MHHSILVSVSTNMCCVSIVIGVYLFATVQDFPQNPPTEAQLWNIAVDISDCWYQIGVQIGLTRYVLDRIEAEYENPDRRGFQMLCMAYEKPCFTTCADLAKLLYNTSKSYVNAYLK